MLMKILAIFAALAAMAFTSLMAAETSAPVYEVRVYYAAPGKLDELHARFRNHTLKLFEKHGMKNVGYFVPVGENPTRKLWYVLEYPSREAREKSWRAFVADPVWLEAHKASEKNGKLVEKLESFYLERTDYSPVPKIEAKGGRVFELRTYTTPPGKLDALNARFRDHTLKLFEKHGMNNLVYWTKMKDQKDADTTLIYLLTHASQDAAKKSFDDFRKDPAWVAAKSASEKDGSLTVDGGVKSEFLVPTDYSPLK